jgi:hypothetical protein
MPRDLTTAHVALLLGISPSRARAMQVRGELPATRRGRRYFTSVAAWTEWLMAANERALRAVAGVREGRET